MANNRTENVRKNRSISPDIRPLSASTQDVAQILRRRGYRIGRPIGSGSYGKVFQAFRFGSAGEQVKIACKIIDRNKVSRDFIVKFLPREINITRQISHKNVVRFHDIIDLNDNVFIFMEFCSNGDLLHLIQNHGPLHDNQARHFFRDLVSALEYLHSLQITHRDLKCENILLTSRNIIKITDFGFSRRLAREVSPDPLLSETFCGSRAYTAPEILRNRPYDPKRSDVWSLGCILHVMLTAVLPFGETNYRKMLYRQYHRLIRLQGLNDHPLCEDATSLIKNMLEPIVKKRISLDRIQHHKWMNKISDARSSEIEKSGSV